MNTQEGLKQRVFYLDFLRAIGCLAVVMLHVSSNFTLDTFGSVNYWIGVVFDGMVRFAVPLFVMISGALFLNENYVFTVEKLRQHVKKLVLFFFGWSVIYCLVFTVLKNFFVGTPISLSTIVVSCIKGPYHLWFIPMIVGLYLITPFLRLWICKENKKMIQQFLFLGFLFNVAFPLTEVLVTSFAPDFLDIFDVIANVRFHYGVGYVFYFVLGWYLHQFDTSYTKQIACGGIAGFVITIFGTVLFAGMGVNSTYFFDYFSVGVLISSVAIFVCVKSILRNKNISSKFVKMICHHSMGIYAMHIGVFPLFTYILKIKHAALAVPIYFVIASGLPVMASAVLKRIKVLQFLV